MNAIASIPRVIGLLLAAIFKTIFGISISEASADLIIGITLITLAIMVFGITNIMLFGVVLVVGNHIYKQATA